MKTPQSGKLMYFAAIYKDVSGGYWTRFVDFPAADQGDSIDDAIAQTTEFLKGIVEFYADEKKELPAPTPLGEFRNKLDPDDGEPECIVPVYAYPAAPTVRIQLTARTDKVAMVDDYAKRHHFTRSELMINATLDYIKAHS